MLCVSAAVVRLWKRRLPAAAPTSASRDFKEKYQAHLVKISFDSGALVFLFLFFQISVHAALHFLVLQSSLH